MKIRTAFHLRDSAQPGVVAHLVNVDDVALYPAPGSAVLLNGFEYVVTYQETHLRDDETVVRIYLREDRS